MHRRIFCNSVLLNLTDDQRRMTCSDKLLSKLSHCLPDVKQLGPWLNLKPVEIQHIQHANPYSLANQIFDLLVKWKQRCRDPTVQALLEALQQANIGTEYDTAVLDYCNGKYK